MYDRQGAPEQVSPEVRSVMMMNAAVELDVPVMRRLGDSCDGPPDPHLRKPNPRQRAN